MGAADAGCNLRSSLGLKQKQELVDHAGVLWVDFSDALMGVGHRICQLIVFVESGSIKLAELGLNLLHDLSRMC